MFRIIEIASNPGDLILDSFAGSGTTGAVAHKMGRHWIMVELGEHCHTHIIPRLKKVIDGKDSGGVTAGTNWQGGGGFRYYRLGPSLIVEDAWRNPVINPAFNAAMLAEAMCKLEGFTYAPSEDVFRMHGRSTEQDFIYVTTQFMSKEMLTRISDEVGPDRSLLLYCTAFRCDPNQFANLTLKKIPNAVLTRANGARTIIAWQWQTSRPSRWNLGRNPLCLRTLNHEPRPGVGSIASSPARHRAAFCY